MSVFATRLLRRLLTLSVGAALSDSILGDLEEERQRREARSSRLAALWFWSNGIRVVAYVLTQRSQTAISTLVKASFVDTLLLDIRHAVRRLARRPAGAAALVLVLALGVGLTSAMFALADPFLLRPLPYQDPNRLVVVTLSSDATRLITKNTVLPTYDAAPRPTAFTYLHNPRSASGGLSFLIRSDGSSDALREPVRRALASVNPTMAIREYSTVGARLSNSVRDRSFATLMLTLFAVASLSVAVAGIISVVMFTVAGRTREIAIRMAIGAQGHQIRWLVLREVCWAAIAGVVAGGLATRWLSGAMTSLVYGVEAESWVATVVTAAGTVLLMAIASTVPARRALRLQPTVALKVE